MANHKLTLSILRHSKASRGADSGIDSDRDLTDRGRRNATDMGVWMANAGIAPVCILCSGAVRTRETLDVVLLHLLGKSQVQHLAELYLATPLILLKHLHAVQPPDAHVLMIGHNPGLHALALDLIAEGPADRIAALGRGLPTSGLVVITFDAAAWTDVVTGTGTLVSFTTPDDLA